MDGNRTTLADAGINHAVRITFGVVHGVLLTLFCFAAALMYPSLSQFMFGLFGFVIAPVLSLGITAMCNLCVNYVSQSGLTVEQSLKTAWIPPLGILCVAILLLPLELMPSLGFQGPLSTLAVTFVTVNCILVTLLQVYAAKDIQGVVYSSGSSGPT